MADFVIGKEYTRAAIQALLGLDPKPGGNWATGYNQHGGEWFLFPNIGVPGRTGHDYDNRWVPEGLHWYGKTGSHMRQPAIKSMLQSDARVHLFTRTTDRSPFVYKGLANAVRAIDAVPVEIIWSVPRTFSRAMRPLPEEVAGTYTEGAVQTILVNAHERDPAARRACIAHWGVTCVVCGMNFGERYGPLAAGYIHVHHLDPLASAVAAREVDPIAQLRPVCPNCHGVIHLEDPPATIERVKAMLQVRLDGQSST